LTAFAGDYRKKNQVVLSADYVPADGGIVFFGQDKIARLQLHQLSLMIHIRAVFA
jgi:hypothetical protein